MNKTSGQLTVFFENQFWIGVFEQISDGRLSVCKVTFGAEPKEYDVFEFILRNYDKLEFSAAVEITLKQNLLVNVIRRYVHTESSLCEMGIAYAHRAPLLIRLFPEIPLQIGTGTKLSTQGL